MSIPADLKYTKEHEWARIENDEVTFGISEHAQEALGDIVFVELPELGRLVEAGEAFAVVESVKAVSDVYAPVAGEIIAVNEALEDAPELLNESCYGKGWLARIKTTDTQNELMTAEQYATFLEE